MKKKQKRSAATTGSAKKSSVAVVERSESAFARNLIKRGQAVRATGKNKEAGATAGAKRSLPSGVTHEIVGETPDGTPIVKRNRFSLT